MKKSGLKKPNKLDKFNATDISLGIILAFCSLVIFFIGYHCCQRKRSKGKNKAAKRKIRNKESHQENDKLFGGSFQESDDSLDKEGQNSNTSGQHSCTQLPQDEEGENQSPNNYPIKPSLLSRIMLSWPLKLSRSHDNRGTECSKSLPGTSSPKQNLYPFGSQKDGQKRGSYSDIGRRQDIVPSSQTQSKTKAKNTETTTNKGKKSHFTNWYNKLPGRTSGKACGTDKDDIGDDELSKKNKNGKKGSGNTTNYGKGFQKNEKQLVEELKDEDSTHPRDTRAVEPCGKIPSLDGVSSTEYVIIHSQAAMETNNDHVEKQFDDAMSEDSHSNFETRRKNGQTDESICQDLSQGSRRTIIEQKIERTRVDSCQKPPSPKDDFRGELFQKDESTDHSPRKEAALGQRRQRVESIGEVYNVVQYARNEWKSDTDKAKAIREGYFQIPQLLGLNSLRVIRGDNYCAIRAALFQVLAKKIPFLSNIGRIQEIPQGLKGLDWIDEWNFASRLPVRRDQVRNELKACLKELYDLVQLNAQMANEEGRVTHLLSYFNFKPLEFEVRLLEAVKFLMLYTAIRLYTRSEANEDVPLFAMIMFARDTSMNPRDFMAKHLNAVGDTGGLEQVEMHLLGYTLGVTIKVVRPSHYGQPDFIASYPEDMPNRTPVVTMVAEDDRHYNILS